jgi:hypothetical protein
VHLGFVGTIEAKLLPKTKQLPTTKLPQHPEMNVLHRSKMNVLHHPEMNVLHHPKPLSVYLLQTSLRS